MHREKGSDMPVLDRDQFVRQVVSMDASCVAHIPPALFPPQHREKSKIKRRSVCGYFLFHTALQKIEQQGKTKLGE